MPIGLVGCRSFRQVHKLKLDILGGLWFYYRYHQPLVEPHFKTASWV